MGTGRTLLGFVGLAGFVAAHATVGSLVRRRWFPHAPAPLRQLVAGIAGLTSACTTGVALGSVGWFRPLPLVLASTVVAVAAALLGRMRPPVDSRPNPPVALGGEPEVRSAWFVPAGAVVVCVLAVRWLAELLQTIERGFSHADELHYHLTHAALFAKTGQTWPVRFTSVGDGAAYHPAHSELLHGVGISVLGSDFASIFLNVVFVAMALAAGWTIGAHVGSGPAGALIVASVLSLPLVVAESGSTLNDTMAIALALTSVALLLAGSATEGAPMQHVVIAGMAAGLAVGTKLTVVVAVGALVLVVVARPAADRWRRGAAFVGGAVAAGGYWYARNLAATGNPVPALSFGPLPGPDLELQRAVEFPVVNYLGDPSIWREFFVPGLVRFFGPMWVLLPAAAVVAAVLACTAGVRRRDPRWSMVAACGLLSLVGYAITPTSAAGRPAEPVLFVFNLRYALPGLLLCTLAGLAHPILRRHPSRGVAVAAALFVAANLHGIDPRRGAIALAATAALAVGAVALVSGPRRALVPASVLGVLGVLAAGVVLNERYLERRWTADLARWGAYEAGDQASGVRVGLTGFPQSYPFFGARLDNEVVTLGDDAPGNELAPITDCEAWWRTVDERSLDVVVVLSEPALAASELGRHLIHDPIRWLRTAGAAPVVEARDALVFDVRSASKTCEA